MRSLDVVSADGVSLDTAHHPAKTEPIGTVIQAHGITVDKDEGGSGFGLILGGVAVTVVVIGGIVLLARKS